MLAGLLIVSTEFTILGSGCHTVLTSPVKQVNETSLSII